MEPFETDAGTLQLLESLTPAGRCVLHGYLRQCDAQRMPGSFPLDATLDGIHFTRRDVRRMKLVWRSRGHLRSIVATTDFVDGGSWKDGRLRIANVDAPHVALVAMIGRTIEQVVDTPPVQGMRIVRARTLAGPDLALSTDVRAGNIPYVDDRPSRRPLHCTHEPMERRA